MKKPAVIFSLALTVGGHANEALDLLDSEAEQSQNVFEHAARVPASGKDAANSPKKFPKPDPKFPMRWAPDLPPRFPFEVGRETTIAPRGLFEYQYREGEIARGAKLSRARVGVALETFYGIEILADALFSSSGEYEGWETLRAGIPLNDQVFLAAGKFPPPFSTEYSRDAAVRWFPTLSPLTAQIAPSSSLGVMLEGRDHFLDWKLGWFGSDADRSIPSLDGKGYLLASIATASNRGGDESNPDAYYQRWDLDYIYNMDGATGESIPMGYRHIVSAGAEFSSGHFDFYTEFLLARSSENTVYGVTAAGRYWLLQDAVSFVGRYQYATSRNPGGLVTGWGIPATGADATFPSDFPVYATAGQLSSIYGGLNVHFDDDNFIIGTGVEYRSLSDVVGDDDFSSWAWNTFARYSF
jgi:hypothetical protein